VPLSARSAWLRARYPLVDVGGFLEVTWSDGRAAVGQHEEAALKDVSGYFASAFRRVNARTETPITVLRPVPRPESRVLEPAAQMTARSA
jgi:hypothetical protein